MGIFRATPVFVLAALTAACSSPPPAPTPPPPLKPDLVVSAGIVEAALGHRASVLTLTNNGTTPRQVNGYPAIRVLDGTGKPLDVEVTHGTSYFSSDPGPKPFTLAPHEKLMSVVSWSNTVTSGDKTSGAAVAVTPTPEQPEQTVPLETDLGTTGEITATAWLKEIPK